MYLKSLILKGFKSFADKSVLKFEPGITAIVGPNGSGKSNIADAVLWVLGERNAKNLRGVLMEDVIFAGSSARKSVNVAEVTLVLDNSQGKLPVDFDEVAITRRMYRNGESDYLINNSLVRRCDVQDILHDTGLGTATHSIISQGHLDRILASKAEDRRSLIEEAAGVLKHKQRKAKSLKKIEKIDNNLARINDVVSEVNRQLVPLKRKARQAERHIELSNQLKEVQLQLAAWNLRNHQSEWNKILAEVETAKADQEKQEKILKETQQQYEEIQAGIRKKSGDVTIIAAKQTEVSNIVERFESAKRIINEKNRVARHLSQELSQQIDANQDKRDVLLKKHEDAQNQATLIRQKLEGLSQRFADINQEREKACKFYQEAEECAQKKVLELDEMRNKREELRTNLSLEQEQLSQAIAAVKVTEDIERDFNKHVEHSQASLENAKKNKSATELTLQKQQQELDDLLKCEAHAQSEYAQASAAQNELREKISKLNFEIRGLEEIQRKTHQHISPLRSWLLHENASTEHMRSLLDNIKVVEGYENLVEIALGSDSLALVEENANSLPSVYSSVMDSNKQGSVPVLFPQVGHKNTLNSPACDTSQEKLNETNQLNFLIEKISYPNEMKSVVSALLGDVVLCDSFQEALKALKDDTRGFRFICPDGTLLSSRGKILFRGKTTRSDSDLVRGQQIQNAKLEQKKLEDEYKQQSNKVESLLEQKELAQQKVLDARSSLALCQIEYDAANKDLDQWQERVTSGLKQQEANNDRLSSSERIIQEKTPHIDALKLELQNLNDRMQQVQAEQVKLQDDLVPLRTKERTVQSEYSEIKLEYESVVQQEKYARQSVDSHANQLVSLSKENQQTLQKLAAKQLVMRRSQPLIESIQSLIASSSSLVSKLDSQIEDAQQSSSGDIERAQEISSKYNYYQDELSKQNQYIIKLEQSKAELKVQVQTFVDRIVQNLNTPLEQALNLPNPENVDSLTETEERLRTRIASMGAVNPNAAQEYDELKERFDYLNNQLEDLRAARISLRKIDKLIDNRMKEYFAQTLEIANKHFTQIFAQLFPGGNAKLSLTDPDDIDNSGLEVEAQPCGKRVRKMSLLSGGEKSLTALALLFAVYKTRSTPFYILDEVEAALDDSNLQRLMNYLEDLRSNTQLIMITHQRRTMETANALFGISMQGDGVTQLISQRIKKD